MTSPAPAVEPVIRVEHLSKAYRVYTKPSDMFWELVQRKQRHHPVRALHDVSFEVRRGEVLGIIGANGAGKSTLLKILSGTLEATGGSFSVKGKISAILELGTGFHPEYTGRENVYMGCMYQGLSRRQIDKKVDSIIDFSGLREVIDLPFKTYSSGMMGRLTFATAVSIDPDILIIDEALAAGDSFFVHKCSRKIVEICKSGCTVIMVTHGTHLVAQLCDRAIWLANGTVRMSGDPLEVVRSYDYHIHELIGEGRGQIVEHVPTGAVADPDLESLDVDQAAADASPPPVAAEPAAIEAGDPGSESAALEAAANPTTDPARVADAVQAGDQAGETAPAPEEPSASSPTSTRESQSDGHAIVEIDPVTAGLERGTPAEATTAEATAAEAAPHGPQSGPDTAGTHVYRRGPVTIVRVEFLDKNGKDTRAFRIWESMTIRVWYRCDPDKIPEETLGLAIGINRQSDMISLSQFSTCNVRRDAEMKTYDQSPYRLKASTEGYVEAVIDPIQLGVGAYLFSVGLLPNIPGCSDFYEYHHFFYPLSILRDGFPLYNTAYYPWVRWHHEPDASRERLSDVLFARSAAPNGEGESPNSTG